MTLVASAGFETIGDSLLCVSMICAISAMIVGFGILLLTDMDFDKKSNVGWGFVLGIIAIIIFGVVTGTVLDKPKDNWSYMYNVMSADFEAPQHFKDEGYIVYDYTSENDCVYFKIKGHQRKTSE